MLLQLVIFNAATTSWASKHFVNNFVHSVLTPFFGLVSLVLTMQFFLSST